MRIRLNKRWAPRGARAGLRTTGGKGGRLIGFLFGLPFLLGGALFCLLGGIQPLAKVHESRSWPQVPCVITHSEVLESHGDDSTTYSVHIEFRYSYDGSEYTGGRYDFSTGSSSGYGGKAEVVDRYPVGHETVCLVNPRHPPEAVLSRRVPLIVYFAIPFSSIFMLVGLGIMLASLGWLPRRWKEASRSQPDPAARLDGGEMELKPPIGGLGKVLGTLFVACFWNGIVGVFAWQAVKSFAEGEPEWFLVFFLIPFVAVGVFLIGTFFTYLLALANPTFRLFLSEGSPRLGETVSLRWQAAGSISRLAGLEFLLEGRESATYRRGTRSTTDHSVFYREVIHQAQQFTVMPGGTLDLTIPAGLMHSFVSGNNRIEWRIQVKGTIHRWPDVNEHYAITVRPIRLN